MNVVVEEIEIRDAVEGDLGEILSIDDLVFSTTWSPSFLRQQLCSEKHSHRIIEKAGKIVGHSGLMRLHDEGHITTMAVSPNSQGFGLGRLLLADLCSSAISLSLVAITLEVRVGNTRAQSLYQKFGFVPAGVRPNYYSDTGEDALIMWLNDLFDERVQETIEETKKKLLQAKVKNG
ncbi:MAG: ribosomal protein S18-alanine N-acetyltransferase [Acidimicrobiales bacterium]|jgi:ribosomal-protein-alanine N-acetyltransferase|nr:ribosomal protein S18-alanine N-acetyltransferase [Acidimicrobiales bacterium]MDP6895161.1 ribosomal protein S18-alanine N-acetyltransferase [Acidimicrobiales bacterium]|tara:strand:+ start:1596 stop:2126 length:531 start_codon:yes stop_codon:yes gene_type:complete